MENDINRSLDLSEVLSRIHKQAVLIGGPHDGKRAPLPPLIYDNDHPKYLCQPGRHGDQTWYHYQLSHDTCYIYVDHCDTLPAGPHHPDRIEWEEERDRTKAGKLLFLSSAAVIVACSAFAMGNLIGYAIAFVTP